MSRRFYLTCGIDDAYETVRQDLVDYFEGVKEYCVSNETNHVNKGYHIHAFLHFYGRWKLKDVRSICESFCCGILDVQCVKSMRMSCNNEGQVSTLQL